MRKVYVRDEPGYAGGILLVGFMVCGFLCLPAITRRDSMTIAPFLLAMPWLWPAPILLSAPLVRFGTSRFAMLVAYMAGVAVVFGGLVGYAVPRSVTIEYAVANGAVLALPMLLLGLLTDALVRGSLRLIGVRHLPKPAAAGAVDPEEAAAASSMPRRVRTYMAVVALAAVLFPFAYHHGALAIARWQGARAAERDWAAGEGWWPVMVDEPESSPGAAGTLDVKTGLPIVLVSRGLLHETWWRSYRDAIRRKVTEHGPAPMAKNLFTEQQLHDLVEGPSIRQIAEFPFIWGNVQIEDPGPVAGRPFVVYIAIVQRQEEVLVAVTPLWGGVYLADGTHIQHIPDLWSRELFTWLEERFGDQASGGADE
jgi:hypothetical protein